MANGVFEKQWLKPFALMTEEEKQLAANCTLIRFNSSRSYYEPLFRRGRVCLEYFEGRVFSSDELAEIEDAEKLVVQIPQAKPAIDAIYGTLIDTLKDGVVTAQGPEDAASQNIFTTYLKLIAKDNNIRMKAYEAARNTGITSVPGWIWVSNRDPNDPDEEGVSLDYEEWDAVLPSPRWKDRQLRDLDYCFRIRQMGADEVEQEFETSIGKQQIQERLAYIEGIASSDYTERETIMQQIRESLVAYDGTGLVSIFEMTHWVRMDTKVYMTPDGHTDILPMFWSPEEVQIWMQQNPTAQVTVKKERVLWVTTVAATGQLLANGPHWMQNGMFPGAPVIPDRVNGKWVGLMEPILDLLKSNAYAETDYVHAVRTTSNNAWKFRSGAVKDKEEFRRQLMLPNGMIEVEPSFSLDDVQRVENGPEQKAFMNWMEISQAHISEQLVERNFLGGDQTSQESDKVVQTRIKQTISKLAMPVYGMHEFWLRVHRLALKAIQYAVHTQKMIRLVDPMNGVVQYNLNEPIEWDPEGNILRTMNNLQSANVDLLESEADNSLTGQEHERNLFQEFFKVHANSPPEIMESAALSWPSITVQAFGRRLEEQRKAKENAPPPPPEVKYSVGLTGADLGLDGAQKVAVNIGALKEDQVEQEDGSMGENMNPPTNQGMPPTGLPEGMMP